MEERTIGNFRIPGKRTKAVSLSVVVTFYEVAVNTELVDTGILLLGEIQN